MTEPVVFDPNTMRFTQGNRVHQDVTMCLACKNETMKLVDETSKDKTFRCSTCGAVVTEGK